MLEQKINSIIAYLFIVTVGIGFLTVILHSAEKNLVQAVEYPALQGERN